MSDSIGVCLLAPGPERSGGSDTQQWQARLQFDLRPALHLEEPGLWGETAAPGLDPGKNRMSLEYPYSRKPGCAPCTPQTQQNTEASSKGSEHQIWDHVSIRAGSADPTKGTIKQCRTAGGGGRPPSALGSGADSSSERKLQPWALGLHHRSGHRWPRLGHGRTGSNRNVLGLPGGRGAHGGCSPHSPSALPLGCIETVPSEHFRLGTFPVHPLQPSLLLPCLPGPSSNLQVRLGARQLPRDDHKDPDRAFKNILSLMKFLFLWVTHPACVPCRGLETCRRNRGRPL